MMHFKTFGRVQDIANIGNSVVYNENELEKHLKYMGTKSKVKSGLVVKNEFNTNIISLTEFPRIKSRLF